jgi:hypothetical protein
VKVQFAVLATLLAAVALTSAAGAHVSREAPVVHAIDHLRWKTNELRGQAGRKPIATDFLYRTTDDAAYRLWVKAVWEDRLRAARLGLRIPAVWKRLARCETGGDWRHHNGPYEGGLGFYGGSWDAYRPAGYPRDAHRASPAEQVAVARLILADVGWSAWPACSVRLGLR